MFVNRWVFVLYCVFLCVPLRAGDAPQWGIDQGRNRISSEKNLPVSFQAGKKDPTSDRILDAGPNVRWAVPIGSRTYTPPIVAGGRVLIGTNNDAEYEPGLEGDYGVLLCLDEKTGEFLWQYTAPKVQGIKFFDVEHIGITSTPTVVDDWIYFVNNRGTVCVLELATGKPVWTRDLIETFGVRQHDTNNSSIVVHDGLLYLGTANGLDDRHRDVERPEAPTLVVLDAETGRPLARDGSWLQTGISHGQWCLPALGEVRNSDGSSVWTIFYGMGNGLVNAFWVLDRAELLASAPPEDQIGEYGSKLFQIGADWTFDGNGPEIVDEVQPIRGGHGSPSITCLPPLVFAENRLFVLFGHDGITGARPFRAFMSALDPTDSAAKTSRLLWKTPNRDKGVLAPQCVADGLVYLGDRSGGLHCLDASDGETVWTLDLKGDHWAGPMVADGKIYIGTDRRMFYVLKAGREPEILAEIEMPGPMFAGAVAANGTLFIPMNGFLYAVQSE